MPSSEVDVWTNLYFEVSKFVVIFLKISFGIFWSFFLKYVPDSLFDNQTKCFWRCSVEYSKTTYTKIKEGNSKFNGKELIKQMNEAENKAKKQNVEIINVC